MKKNFSFALFSLCSLIMLAPSCSSEDTPAIPEVGSFGKIQFDREKFGYGQDITASCQLPATSTDIIDLAYTWSVNDNEAGTIKVENGISYYTFTLPSYSSNPDEMDCKIQLTASTSYTDAKLPAPVTANIKVQRPDVYLSFWGDNVDLTKKNITNLTVTDNKYYVTLTDYLRSGSSNITACEYSFTDNKLSQVEELREITPTTDVQAYLYLKTFNGLINSTLKYYNFTVSQSYISITDQTQKDYAYDSTDNTYLGETAEYVLQNNSKIIICAQNNNTELIITTRIIEKASSPSGYAVNCDYIYTPKK